MKLIFEIYHKIGQNKITSINRNIDDSLYINKYKEFLTNFGLLNILITKDQMNFIYNRLTRKTETKENNNNNTNEKNFEQYLTYNDFRMSLILLTIMAHLNNKDMKITEEDYNNNLTVEKIEELFLDAYNFLTDEEQDVQLEIKNTTAEAAISFSLSVALSLSSFN